jgi:hypothetical protein
MTATKIIDPPTKTILERAARDCIANAKNLSEARKWFIANAADYFGQDDLNDSEWAEFLKERNAIFNEAKKAEFKS